MEQTVKKSKRTFNGFDGHIRWGTRLAYAGGDVACNIVFGMVGTLLTYYYTKCASIPIATVGIVMLVSRVFDGISDVVMGIIVDKTKSRFGKARPWLLWMAVPFAASAILLFCVPQVGEDLMWVKILYMFVTYNFCSTICYTAINLPYGTLSTFMTDKSHERDMLGNVRMGLSPIGKIIAVSFTLPLVKIFGGGTEEAYANQNAWIITMSIWASLALILLLINFFLCPEKVNPAMNPQKKALETKLPMKKALKFLVTNKYFWFVLILWMFQSTSFGVIGTILPYYCEHVAHNVDLYSMLFLTETLTLVGCVFICMPLVKKVGKRNLALFGTFIALAGQLVFAFVPMTDANCVPMLYMSAITRSIGLAPLNAVVFGMLGDVVDYGHWKNGYRQEAFICAGGSVGTKLGSGLASVAITQILAGAGFVEGSTGEQPPTAVTAIQWIYIIAPLIVAGGVMAVLFFYKLDKGYDKMMVELKEREAKLTKEAMHTSIIRLHELEKLEEQESTLLSSKTDLEKKLADINEQLKNISKEKDKVNKRDKRR